jgi:hypothetical protein
MTKINSNCNQKNKDRIFDEKFERFDIRFNVDE